MNTAEQDAATRPHHPYSPSKLQYLEACPGFKGTEETNEAAERGTAQHVAFEQRDVSRLDDHEADAVQRCIALFDALVREFTRNHNAPPAVIQESYDAVDDQDTSAGYLDIAVVSPDGTEAVIVDLKFGKWPVEPAETNLQGIAYMLGLKRKFPQLAACRVEFWLPHRDEIDSHLFVLDDKTVAGLLTRVRLAVARAKVDDVAQRRPSSGICLFCARLGNCPAAASAFLNIAKKFAPLHVPEDVTPSTIADAAKAGEIMQLADLAKTWGEAVRSEISRVAIEENCPPPGYEIVCARRRSVINVTKLKEIARQFMSEDEIDAATKINLTPLEKAIRARAPRGEKKETVDHFAETLLTEGAVKQGDEFAYLQMVRPRKTQEENENG